MEIKEIQAKSLLIKHKRIDSWFLARYGMNLYRACAHDCAYCDGRAEKHYTKELPDPHISIRLLSYNLVGNSKNTSNHDIFGFGNPHR